jgi:hypothetical protein
LIKEVYISIKKENCHIIDFPWNEKHLPPITSSRWADQQIEKHHCQSEIVELPRKKQNCNKTNTFKKKGMRINVLKKLLISDRKYHLEKSSKPKPENKANSSL